MRAHPRFHLSTNEKNVLFLITGLGHGGAETQIVRIACALKKKGWIVNIVTILKPVAEPLIQLLKDGKVPLRSLDLGTVSKINDLRIMGRFLRILEDEKPYVLCSFLFHANIFGQLASKLAGVPRFVTSIRAAKFESKNRAKFAKFFHTFDNLTTLNSNQVAKEMIAKGVLKPDRVRIVNNAISIEKYIRPDAIREKIRGDLGISPTTFVFIAVGRVHPVKGYTFLVDACQTLGTEFKLLIVGKDDDDALKKKVHDSKLTNVISLLGYRVDIPELLSAADALVLSSLSEGLPNALIEGHAAGLPAISTRVGGAPEILLANESGFIVPPGNAEALSQAMKKMMALPKNKREEMGKIGQDHVDNTFGLDAIVTLWEHVLLAD